MMGWVLSTPARSRSGAPGRPAALSAADNTPGIRTRDPRGSIGEVTGAAPPSAASAPPCAPPPPLLLAWFALPDATFAHETPAGRGAGGAAGAGADAGPALAPTVAVVVAVAVVGVVAARYGKVVGSSETSREVLGGVEGGVGWAMGGWGYLRGWVGAQSVGEVVASGWVRVRVGGVQVRWNMQLPSFQTK